MKTKSVLIAGAVLFVSIGVTALVNEVYATHETVGEPYTVSFSYCGEWAGVGGTRHCSKWLTGHERRINTKVHSFLWDHDGYKLVDR